MVSMITLFSNPDILQYYLYWRIVFKYWVCFKSWIDL